MSPGGGSADPDAEKVRFYLAPGEKDNTLELFAEDYFPDYVEKMHARLGLSDDAKDFETFFLSVSAHLEVDKQGRVLLPQQQLQSAGIGKHIVLLAARDRLIMMNREEGRKFIDKGWSTYRKMREVAELKNTHRAANPEQ